MEFKFSAHFISFKQFMLSLALLGRIIGQKGVSLFFSWSGGGPAIPDALRDFVRNTVRLFGDAAVLALNGQWMHGPSNSAALVKQSGSNFISLLARFVLSSFSDFRNSGCQAKRWFTGSRDLRSSKWRHTHVIVDIRGLFSNWALLLDRRFQFKLLRSLAHWRVGSARGEWLSWRRSANAAETICWLKKRKRWSFTTARISREAGNGVAEWALPGKWSLVLYEVEGLVGSVGSWLNLPETFMATVSVC